MRDVREYFEKCLKMCDEAGIPYREITDVITTKRFINKWGTCNTCNHRQFTIKINAVLCDEKAFPTDEGLINTLLHEILHTCPDSFNHGETWLAHCRTIYNNYGIKINVGDNAENKGADEVAYNATFRYVCRCKKCGATLGRNRMQDFIKNPNRYTHTGCGGEFERIK